MHEFIDKYTQLLHNQPNNSEEEKVEEYECLETHKVLEAINETQSKQRRQKRINYIIEQADEIQLTAPQIKEQRITKKPKGCNRHSQSVVISMPAVKENHKAKGRSKHRRTESINLDSNTVKRIMSMNLDFKTLTGSTT